MASVAIKGARYRVKPEEADRFGPFTKTFLAEGDSWMDASAWNQGSLPEFLAREYNRSGVSHLILNLATSGHTLTRIVDMMKGDFVWWLKQQTYDGILFSAGGNDFIDAARDAPPGQGLLEDCRGKPTPAGAADCIRASALVALQGYLNANFKVIYDALRRSAKNASTPIYLNGYDTPVARDAPAIRGLVGPWLYAAYTKNGIPVSLWPGLTDLLFDEIRKTVEGWASGRTNVVLVPTTGLLDPADAASAEESGDWINEIHPNKRGWRKQAAAWRSCLDVHG
jgi:lysophospholipase L1-like esterase